MEKQLEMSKPISKTTWTVKQVNVEYGDEFTIEEYLDRQAKIILKDSK